RVGPRAQRLDGRAVLGEPDVEVADAQQSPVLRGAHPPRVGGGRSPGQGPAAEIGVAAPRIGGGPHTAVRAATAAPDKGVRAFLRGCDGRLPIEFLSGRIRSGGRPLGVLNYGRYVRTGIRALCAGGKADAATHSIPA